MTDINTAVKELVDSTTFKEDAKKQPRLRIYLARVRAGTFGSGATLNLLQEYGYNVVALSPEESAKQDFKPVT